MYYLYFLYGPLHIVERNFSIIIRYIMFFSLVTDSLYPSGPSPMAAGLYMGLACCLGNRKFHCNINIYFIRIENYNVHNILSEIIMVS